MANNHIKGRLKGIKLVDVQTQSKMRLQFTFIRMAKGTKRQKIASTDEEREKPKSSSIASRNLKRCSYHEN